MWVWTRRSGHLDRGTLIGRLKWLLSSCSQDRTGCTWREMTRTNKHLCRFIIWGICEQSRSAIPASHLLKPTWCKLIHDFGFQLYVAVVGVWVLLVAWRWCCIHVMGSDRMIYCRHAWSRGGGLSYPVSSIWGISFRWGSGLCSAFAVAYWNYGHSNAGGVVLVRFLRVKMATTAALRFTLI